MQRAKYKDQGSFRYVEAIMATPELNSYMSGASPPRMKPPQDSEVCKGAVRWQQRSVSAATPPALSRNSTTGALYVRRAKMGEVGDVSPGGEGLGAEPRPTGGLAWLTRA